jgi:hypothetical protein
MSMSTNKSDIDLRELGPSAAEPFDADRTVRNAPISVPSDGSSSIRATATNTEAERDGAFRLQELLDRTRQLQGARSS